MHDGSDHSPPSRISREVEPAHPTLSRLLFTVAAVVWPLIVYAAYLCVAYRELGAPDVLRDLGVL